MMAKKIVLASNSPRRRELLSSLGLIYEVRVLSGIDESFPPELPAEEIAQYISRKKAMAYPVSAEELLITADTIVYCDDEVLGKPKDEEDACRMLRKLSGRTHQVITGVTLKTTARTYTFSCVTHVTFAPLHEEEIKYYVQTYKPFDKAGAYGIQEWIGCVGVERIEGSYYNVMGLPVQRLYKVLKEFDVL